ncbi:hypothetical protein LEMLEM_LOCUS1050 [Lemmus lemmus]
MGLKLDQPLLGPSYNFCAIISSAHVAGRTMNLHPATEDIETLIRATD